MTPDRKANPTARERLGRWLAAEPLRSWRAYPPEPEEPHWTVFISDPELRVHGRRIEGIGATEDEAIAAALDALPAPDAAEAGKP